MTIGRFSYTRISTTLTDAINRRAILAFDPVAYRKRNLIERVFCSLKDWRAIATRYGKTARNVLAGICLVLAVTSRIS